MRLQEGEVTVSILEPDLEVILITWITKVIRVGSTWRFGGPPGLGPARQLH